MPFLQVRDLSLRYGEATVLDRLSLSLEKGEFVGLLGSVGSGKTSLLLSLNGVIPKLVAAHVSGSVHLDGKDVSKHSVPHMSRQVAFVFQNPSDQLFAASVEEEIAFGLRNQNVPAAQIGARVKSALREVGLSGMEARDPSSLSHGQKQKIAIACAIASQAPLIVLDEPTSSLDYPSSLAVYSLLERLNRQGRTIIVVDHDTDLLSQHARRFVVLQRGNVVLDGGPEIFRSKLLSAAGVKIPCHYDARLGKLRR